MGRIIIACFSLLISWGFSSCIFNDRDTISYKYVNNKDHTLLIYMVGDESTMNHYVNSNIGKMEAGIIESATPLNLIIYKDNLTYKQSTPVLFQLKLREDRSKVDTIYLKKWTEEQDSTDPEFMAKVAKKVFSKFKSSIRGFDYWGHGLSWIPGNKFKVSDSTGTRSMEYVGVDSKDGTSSNTANKSDIWEIRKAFQEAGLHFDYMLFDACNMGSAEVAYEFRDITDYILAAPTEIQLEGFPYAQTVQALSYITDEMQIVDGLTSVYEGFKDYYNGSTLERTGTMSLIQTSGMEDLYQACLDLESKASDVLVQWEANPNKYEATVQQYGTKSVGSRYYFYDLQDWADRLSANVENVDGSEVKEALEKCVLQHYNTATFNGAFYMKRCYGLGMSIPQFWNISGNAKLDAAYQELQWQL